MQVKSEPKKLDLRLSTNYRARSNFVLFVFSGAFVLLLSRFAYLSLVPNKTRNLLLSRASSQFETDLILAPPRANITDRNGKTLATSITVPSIFVIPKKLPHDKETIRAISKHFNVCAHFISIPFSSRLVL